MPCRKRPSQALREIGRDDVPLPMVAMMQRAPAQPEAARWFE
jgi:hypothetical protein